MSLIKEILDSVLHPEDYGPDFLEPSSEAIEELRKLLSPLKEEFLRWCWLSTDGCGCLLCEWVGNKPFTGVLLVVHPELEHSVFILETIDREVTLEEAQEYYLNGC